ncbi:MAG: alkaline phosphatase family protein, partial [Roseibium sp.]
RIPTVIISPFARKGFVDHTTYDTTSILAFISKRFGLDLLPGIRTQFGDLRNAFEFAEE